MANEYQYQDRSRETLSKGFRYENIENAVCTIDEDCHEAMRTSAEARKLVVPVQPRRPDELEETVIYRSRAPVPGL